MTLAGKEDLAMTRTTLNFPDDDGGINSGVTNKTTKIKFNEDALCRAFIRKFCTLGYLTSSETGEMLGRIGGTNYPRV